MVTADSPDWLPPGFTVKTKHRSGKKVKYYLKVATENADDNGPSSVTKVDVISEETNDSAWLPNGWTVEERRRKRGSTAGLSYKIYTEPSTGSKFYSMASVTRYLDNIAYSDIMTKQNKIDKVGEPLSSTSLQISPVRNTGSISVNNKKKADSLITIDNVNDNVPEQSPQIQSMTNTDGGHEERRKGNSLKISEKTNDSAWLPNGWTVEERRRKRGSREGLSYKMYTESSTGTKFYSKASVTRYLDNIAHTDFMSKQNKIDKVDEPLPNTSLQIPPVKNTGSISVNKRKADSLITIDNVDENVPKQSPKIQSMRNIDGGHEDRMMGNSLVKYYLNIATGKKYNSKNEVIHCAEENNNILLVTPQTKNADDNGTSSVTKVDAISEKTNDSAWLPHGWTVEERRRKRRGSTAGLSYKIYTESSTGRKFYSKASVARYLDSIAHTDIMTKQNKIDNVDEKVPKQVPQIQSMTNTDGGHEDRSNGNSLVKIDNVGEPFPATSQQVVSMTNNVGICEKKRRISSFVTVAVEWSTDKDLPDGWIKEIRTSKSGDRTRKDPFYTDPVSGYMFRSKPDALRYLETNDIGSCACKPRKRELADIKSIENINLSSTPAKLKTQPFLGEESNGGAESSGTKVPAELDTNTLEREQEKSVKSAEMGNKLEPENDVSKKDVVMAVNAAKSSPVADPSTNQQLPESGCRNKTGSRKPKKRRESSSTPTRISKRLAGSEPETKINLDLNEPSLRASLRGSTAKVVDASPIVPLKASNISQSSIIEPAKEAVDQVVIGMEICQDANQPKEVEKPTPTEGSTIPAEQLGATGTTGTNPFVDDQQPQVSQLCYDFGDSWTNPLEFALKTLSGELPIEDTLTFPSCFREPFDATFKEADVWLKQSNFDAPVIQSEFPSHSASSKKQNAVDPSSVSFSGLNFPPSTEVGKKDSHTKFNP